MRYCSMCGSSVTVRVPDGDNRLQRVLRPVRHDPLRQPATGRRHDSGVGRRVLLCRRAIEPRHGKWTLPAGFMEVGETTGGGAMRETLEEAGARVELGPLFSMIDVPHVQQVHIFFRRDLMDSVSPPAPRASKSACSASTRSRGTRSPSARSRTRCGTSSATVSAAASASIPRRSTAAPPRPAASPMIPWLAAGQPFPPVRTALAHPTDCWPRVGTVGGPPDRGLRQGHLSLVRGG